MKWSLFFFRPTLLLLVTSWLLLAGGCCRQGRPTTTATCDSTIETHSTQVVERVVHDTVTVALPLQQAERTTFDTLSHLSTDYAESDASIDSHGMLHHTLHNKSTALRIPVTVTQTEQLQHNERIVYRDRTVTLPVQRPLTRLQRALMWSGGALWLATLLWCLVRLWRPLRQLLQ